VQSAVQLSLEREKLALQIWVAGEEAAGSDTCARERAPDVRFPSALLEARCALRFERPQRPLERLGTTDW
jgi:hypothetical protein